MRIALINPPYPSSIFSPILKFLHLKDDYCFPLGLGYIAAYTRRAGHTVQIFDPEPCRMPLEVMWEKVKEFKPDVIGITAATPGFPQARELAIEAKKRFNCLVIMGGPHATALPRSTVHGVAGLDAVITGEGEVPLLALAEEFDARGKVDFNKVPGAAFLENWKYRETQRAEPVADLDNLPYPARDLVDIGAYYRHPYFVLAKKSATIISSRGCPSQCTFCANICMGRKFRPHSPAYIIGEIEHLLKNYGIRHFKIYDDCFTADPRRAADICDLIIQKRLAITWEAFGRVNTLADEALAAKMKKAGCNQVLLGIESGSQAILDLMKKGTTLAMAEKCCAALRKQGMTYANSFIIGNDGETEETINATIAFAKKLKSDMATFIIMIPFPGTPLFDKYYKDYDRPDTDWNNWCSQRFSRPYEPRQTALSMAELVSMQHNAFGRFNRAPAQWLRSTIYNFRF